MIDLAGDGRDALVMRWIERGGNGARELIGIWRFDGENVRRMLAVEVAKAQGTSRIEDKVAWVKRGRATDLLVEAGSANGFSASTWREEPAEDAIPILLPWSDERKARYSFRGDEYVRQ